MSGNKHSETDHPTLYTRVMESVCMKLPNCTRAMELAETGAERPLKPLERVALRYHSRLCPFCGCAAGSFESAMEKLREAEAARMYEEPK